ncbi:hypothetical protein [Qipengyuania sp.]|uniref:hypothetical protein n=1 Tax=Qipengyuania sp. TaxID=2004515 RepID=UPI003AF68E5A
MRWLTSLFKSTNPHRQAERLVDRGLGYVREGQTAKALTIARYLHDLRHSGGFEVEAQALARDGAKDQAIAVLESGLEVAPTSWLNANLLGNYLSDQARYDEAFDAYDRAVAIPGANRALIESNRALALQRSGRPDEAREKVAAILASGVPDDDPGLFEFIEGLRSDLEMPQSLARQ